MNDRIKETREAIDKIYQNLAAVTGELGFRFKGFEIGVEPEIKLGVDEDGKVVATLMSVKYNLEKKSVQDTVECDIKISPNNAN